MIKKYLSGTSGQGMSEYLILVLLIAVGSIAAARTVGGTVKSKLNEIHRELNEVGKSERHPKAENPGLSGNIFGNSGD